MALRIETFVAGPLVNNIYLLHDDEAGACVLIDPSIDSEAALAAAQSSPNALAAIWNTHGHFDHIYDNARWKSAFDVPLWAHRGDEYFLEHLAEMALWFGLPAPGTVAPDSLFHNGDEMRVGNHVARVLYTPGHSPGSVSFHFAAEAVCISGDVIFRGSAGRTDLPLCSREELDRSLALIAALPPETRLLPGHGEATTVGAELADNPFIRHLRGAL
jgi:glyoxylase-like metal-dependent hydrolase (beta-lactamase superfamily II)